jgi:hypothetical protein
LRTGLATRNKLLAAIRYGAARPAPPPPPSETKLEQLYRRIARNARLVIGLLIGVLAGYNAGISHDAERDRTRLQREAFTTRTEYLKKAARVKVGKARCEPDPHESCLVCMHRDADLQVLVASHCPL